MVVTFTKYFILYFFKKRDMKETIRRSKSNCIYDVEQNDEAQYDIKEISRVEIDLFK